MTPQTKTKLLVGSGLALLGLAALVGAAPRQEPIAPAPSSAGATPPLSTAPAAAPGALPAPTGSDSVLVQTALSQGAFLRGGPGDAFVRVVARAKAAKADARAPVSLALAIDRSGSMSGEKIEYARRAARQLIAALRPEDRLAIVSYDSRPVVEVRSSPATASNKSQMLAAVQRLEPGDSTDISAGLTAAAAELEGAGADAETLPRVVLISDGLANHGISTREGLSQLARGLRARGITLSTIGVGVDFDHNLMAELAEVGAGQYHYLREPQELAAILERELSQASRLVAARCALTLGLPEGAVVSEVYGYRFEQRGTQLSLALPDLSSGAAIQVVARLRLPTGGEAVSVETRLAFLDYLRDRTAQVAASPVATARLTASASEVEASADKELLVEATRMQTALELGRAADLYDQGRREEANRLVIATSQRTQEAAKAYGSSSLFSLGDHLRALFATSANALGGNADVEVRHEIKSAKKTLGDFNDLNAGAR